MEFLLLFLLFIISLTLPLDMAFRNIQKILKGRRRRRERLSMELHYDPVECSYCV